MTRKLYADLDVSGNKIVSVAAGVNPTDAVNKSQLDSAAGDEVKVQDAPPTPAPGMDIWIDRDAPPLGAGVGSVALDDLTDVVAPSSTPAGKVLGTTATGVWGPVTPSAGGGTPADVAPPGVGGASDVGVSTDYAREDHTHAGATPGHGHPYSPTGHTHVAGDLPSTLATDTEVTSAVSAHAGTAGHEALSSTTPAALGTAAVGTGTTTARADHVHAMPTAANVGAAAVSHTHAQSDVTSLTADLALKAPIASPVFTGTPAAPTVAADTNTTQLATTAFVVGQAASVAPVMNGTVAVGTSLRYARQDHVHASDTSRAASSHTHAATDVNSGTLAIAQVPTGTTGTTVALGNHTHTAPAHSALTGLANDDHTQYGIIVVSGTQPGSPRVGTIWVPSG